jgi:ParB family chromosome partitioning protein
MSNLYSNSIFFVETDKIKANPYQPRREFQEGPLRDLSESIRQYGVLQPLVVSRVERVKEDGGLVTEYELIAGERRLRASKLAGLIQVPVIIRTGDDAMAKLELAIIENLQREDLNAVERARAFLRFVDEFHFTHADIGKKVGKSREYVANTLRLLQLPEEILNALSEGKITEGHTRPLMMLGDRPEEQLVLFKEILYKKISVREAERISRRIATDKVRKKEYLVDPEVLEVERKLQETLGTRVHVEKRETGGSITIDFFSNDDLSTLVSLMEANRERVGDVNLMAKFEEKNIPKTEESVQAVESTMQTPEAVREEVALSDDRSAEEKKQSEEDTDLYNIKNFSL